MINNHDRGDFVEGNATYYDANGDKHDNIDIDRYVMYV